MTPQRCPCGAESGRSHHRLCWRCFEAAEAREYEDWQAAKAEYARELARGESPTYPDPSKYRKFAGASQILRLAAREGAPEVS